MDKVVLSLFDKSANMVKPWADAGYVCYTVDIEHNGVTEEPYGRGKIVKVGADIMDYLPPREDYKIAFGFPPCTNLAVSGARWFKDKGLNGLSEGIEKVEKARQIVEWTDAPWMIENPVSVLSSYWREPDYTFQPFQYDGYTEEDEAYSKRTCLWTSDDFIMPDEKATEDYDDRIHQMPPSEDRSERRSVTPLGFAKAVFEANKEGGDND